MRLNFASYWSSGSHYFKVFRSAVHFAAASWASTLISGRRFPHLAVTRTKGRLGMLAGGLTPTPEQPALVYFKHNYAS